MSALIVARVLWYGGEPLLESLLVKWGGTWTLVQLAIILAFQKPKPSLTKERQK
jgi:hypothetical protein